VRSISSWQARDADQIGLLRRYKAAVEAVVAEADIILYGSRARGDADEDSDYDVLVVVDGLVDMDLEDAIRSRAYPLELETGAVITLMVYSRQDWDSPRYQVMPFHRNVEREGVVL